MRAVRLMPNDDGLQGLTQMPTRLPAQCCTSFGAIELQVMGFVRVRAAVKVPGCTITPVLRKLFNNPLHRLGIFFCGAEVEGFGKS